jgi:hypothetical protein
MSHINQLISAFGWKARRTLRDLPVPVPEPDPKQALLG